MFRNNCELLPNRYDSFKLKTAACEITVILRRKVPPHLPVGRQPLFLHNRYLSIMFLFLESVNALHFLQKNSCDLMSVEDWIEEARRCLSIRRMLPAEQALFLFDH